MRCSVYPFFMFYSYTSCTLFADFLSLPMKRSLPLSVLASLLMLAACQSQSIDTKIPSDGSDVPHIGEEQDDSVMMKKDDAMMPSSPAMMKKNDGAMMQSDTTAITITATNFAFTPNMIRVNKGEKVKLNFAGAEGYHGVGIKDLGINVSFAAGETKTIDLPTDKAGTFSFRCSVPCGPGHREMIGTIIIE